MRWLVLWASFCFALLGYTGCNDVKNDPTIVILKFDTAEGLFDPSISLSKQDAYMKLWKKARQSNPLLNPDVEHGRECGTYRYLKSEQLLTSSYLEDYVIFLVSPGVRPCDYDESCNEVDDVSRAICSHTQFIRRHPIIVDNLGNPLQASKVDTAIFNYMVASGKKLIRRDDAQRIVHLFLFLSDPACKITSLWIDTSKKEDDNTVRVIVDTDGYSFELSSPSKVWEFDVDSVGRIRFVQPATSEGQR